MRFIKLATVCASLAFLASCAQSNFRGEAGIGPENASFGMAYASNELVQSVEYQRGDYINDVQAAFSRDVSDTVTFDFDRAALGSAARHALDAQAEWLRANPTVRVRVTGHTDLVGGENYNDRLGLRRARAAARHLLRRGVARGRIDMVDSKGEAEPVVATDGRERQNRRSVTEVAGFIHGFVGEGMDGRRALLMYRRYVTDTVEAPASANATSGGGDGGG